MERWSEKEVSVEKGQAVSFPYHQLSTSMEKKRRLSNIITVYNSLDRSLDFKLCSGFLGSSVFKTDNVIDLHVGLSHSVCS